MTHMTLDVNYVWTKLLEDLLETGNVVSPRGLATRELFAYRTIVPMNQPFITVHQRTLSRNFACAEAAWILSGDNRLEPLKKYAPSYAKFSDDLVTLSGAYGPPVIDQLPYVWRSLMDDPYSRQAVLTIWRPRPLKSVDVPCTVALQWMIRNGRLHCLATMRSSDAWLGWPYDVHSFSMISAFLALRLRPWIKDIDLGNLYLTAGSQHLYEKNAALSRVCVKSEEALHPGYAPLDLDWFSDDADLLQQLWANANDVGPTYPRWLMELRRPAVLQ